MSPNTVRKYVAELVERGLIQTGARRLSHRTDASKMEAFLYTLLPIQFSIQQFYEQKALQSWMRNVSRNASESGWKRSNRHGRKLPVRPREPRVAAVSDFPGTAGRVPTKKPENRTLRRRAGSFGESGKHGANSRWKEPLRPEHQKGKNREIFGRCGEKQDKRMASEPTLFLITTARSADCIKEVAQALRLAPVWRK